jgi:hypothetical protein
MKSTPGVNLKPKARRAVLWALLTNSAYAKVGFTLKQDSSEHALEELQEISDKYGNPDTPQCDLRNLRVSFRR